MTTNLKKRQNFINVAKNTVITSYDEYFCVGEKVKHEDDKAGTATIISFEPDIESNEIRAITTKGYAHIDFLVKL